MLIAERVRLLEHHADVAADHHRVDRLGVDVLAEELHVALEAEARDQVVHAVEAAQHRALAAARGADEAGDLALLDRHVAVAHGQELAVVDLVDPCSRSRSCRPFAVAAVRSAGLRGERTILRRMVIGRAPSISVRPGAHDQPAEDVERRARSAPAPARPPRRARSGSRTACPRSCRSGSQRGGRLARSSPSQ